MKIDVVDRLRVASPCPISWEQMTGNERVRFCHVCSLNVYNIAELTRKEATALVSGTEGRVCARLFRRSDGTVITRDCPVGLRAIRRRVARWTAAVFAAITSICASAFSYPASCASSAGSAARTSRTLTVASSGELSGQITDPNGQPIAGAILTLTSVRTNQKRTIKSDKKGNYHFIVSDFGAYSLKVSADHFNPYEQEFALHSGDGLRLDITMEVGVLGVIVIEPVRGKGFDLNGVHIRVNDR